MLPPGLPQFNLCVCVCVCVCVGVGGHVCMCVIRTEGQWLHFLSSVMAGGVTFSSHWLCWPVFSAMQVVEKY